MERSSFYLKNYAGGDIICEHGDDCAAGSFFGEKEGNLKSVTNANLEKPHRDTK